MLATPDFNLIVWTSGLALAAAAALTIACRWLWLGRSRATGRWLNALLCVGLLTVVWVYPGLVAAVAILVVALAKRSARPQAN